jgi:hypothetical protein
MGRQIKMAALAVTVMVMFSGLALAQRYDGDDYRYDGGQARQQGYDRGYHDGIGKGRHEGRENDPFDYRTPDWHQATRGYKSWMGPVEAYQRGYQEGYREGFKSGFESVRGNYGNGYGRNGFFDHGYRSPAYNIGYEDGATVAREDVARGKRFNSNPRGPYDDKDHGYRREYGDKHEYKDRYTDGYRQGYEANYRGYRY